eukprot:3302339-Prymnesium_polylepis.1
MSVHVSDHGGSAPMADKNADKKATSSAAPLFIACGLACFAFVFGAPVLPLPFAISMLYTRGGVWIWAALCAALMGSALGTVTVLHVTASSSSSE